MTDLSRKIHIDEFKKNIKTIVDKIIYSMDNNKMYIIVDDDYKDEDNYHDFEDRNYEGDLYWDNLIGKKLSFYDSIKNIEIGNYKRISKRMELNLKLFDYLVETQELWQNDPETNTEFRDIIYNKLTDYRNDLEKNHIRVKGANKSVKIYGFFRNYGLTTDDFPNHKYFELLKLQCTFPTIENNGKICKNCTISNKNLVCKFHENVIIIDKYIRSYVKNILPLPNDVSNIILDYLPMYKLKNILPNTKNIVIDNSPLYKINDSNEKCLIS